MKYSEIFDKIDNLRETGQYDEEQLEAIRYAAFMPDFDENLILNPNIPANYMFMYVKLSKDKKIDIAKYINENWHMKGFDSNQLYYLISSDSKVQDISGIDLPVDLLSEQDYGTTENPKTGVYDYVIYAIIIMPVGYTIIKYINKHKKFRNLN